VGVVRKWVFPVLRLVLFAVIATALVKVAFFPDVAGTSSPDVPGAEIVEPQVAAVIGTIQNDVSLSASVASDAPVEIKATLAGEVRKLLASPGQQVDAGTPILTLRAEVPNADGSVSIKTATVTSPVAGTLADFSALVGQGYSVGDTIGTVALPTFHVSGSLAPEQLYRLTALPTEAQVTITGGPAPFTCTGLTITTATGEGSTGPTVSCAIPAEITVFPGLTAQIVIAGGVAENVIIVPTTAVEGIADTGNVYVVQPDGSAEPRPVTLGLNDGFNVEVVEGLAEGELVLQYVPGAVALPTDGCFVDDMGNEICGAK
jgi:membrane fusion protein, macrolide-specific efflux system